MRHRSRLCRRRARLVRLGARKIRDIEEHGYRWTTLADVEGNEFDLIAG